MRPILITGANGFVGRHLVAELRQRHLPVRALVRQPLPTAAATDADVQYVVGDLLDPASLAHAATGCDAVVHLAAIEFERGGLTFERVHVDGTAAVVAAAVHAGAKRFIYMGQISPGSDQRFRFTYSKWCGEEVVRACALDWTVARAGIVVGPGDHFVREMARLSRWPLVPLATMGRALMQPIAVWDLAAALATLVERPVALQQTIDLAGTEQLSYRALAIRTLAALGRPRPILPLPRWLMALPVAIMAALMRRPPLTLELLRLLDRPNISAENGLPGLLDRAPLELDAALWRAAAGYRD